MEGGTDTLSQPSLGTWWIIRSKGCRGGTQGLSPSQGCPQASPEGGTGIWVPAAARPPGMLPGEPRGAAGAR